MQSSKKTALALILLAGLCHCGGGGGKAPPAKVNCSHLIPIHYEKQSADGVSVSREAIRGQFGTEFEIPFGTLREIVQIRFYSGRNIVGYGTGVVVGRHNILTAAHIFLPPQPRDADSESGSEDTAGNDGAPQEQYDRVTVAIPRIGGGSFIEIEPTFFAINTEFRRRWNAPTDHEQFANDGGRRGDIAGVTVAQDLTATPYYLTPFVIGQDYVPDMDCNECPTDVLTVAGWGDEDIDPADVVYQLAPRGITASVQNGVRNIQDTNVLAFAPFGEHGDSGGPIYRRRPNGGGNEVVGILSGGIGLNLEGEPSGTGVIGGGAATTITQGMLDDLEEQYTRYRLDGANRGGHVYPTAAPTLPSGLPNPTYTSYPEPGPAGTPSPIEAPNPRNSFFYEFPWPHAFIEPGPEGPGHCG